MTRNQPDQRKGSMEGNWATTAAIPNRRKGHVCTVRIQSGSCSTINYITDVSLIPYQMYSNTEDTHFAAKLAFGIIISK